jgi:hypothetical protein
MKSSLPLLRAGITAIDVAQENMGVAQSYFNCDGDVEVREILTSVHTTSDGRMFDYKEQQLGHLCWEWVVAHKGYWANSSVIYLEQQISKKNHQSERAGLLIQHILYSMFLTLYLTKGGPKPICNPACWWRGLMGLPITGDHDTNKEKSIALYQSIIPGGKQKHSSLLQKWGKADDLVEATLMILAVSKQYDQLVVKEFPSLHSEAPNESRIKSSKRLKSLPDLENPPANRFNPLEMRRNYQEFKERRKNAPIVRRNDKLLKKEGGGGGGGKKKRKRKEEEDDSVID